MALEGFRKLSPARSRLPLPWLLVAGLINAMMRSGHTEEAIATCVCFVFYLRPSDLLRLRCSNIIPPHPAAGASMHHWSLALHPWENEKCSKTGEFDEGLVHNNAEFKLNGVLAFLHRRGRQQTALRTTYSTWAAAFNRAAVDLGAEPLWQVTLYQLRQSGASHELASHARPLDAIKKRGRWRTDRSLYRYEKGGQLQQQLNLLPPAVLSRCQLCAGNIGKILLRTSPPMSAVPAKPLR